MFSPSPSQTLVHELAEFSNGTYSPKEVRPFLQTDEVRPHAKASTLKRASSDAERNDVKRAKTEKYSEDQEDGEEEDDQDEHENEDEDEDNVEVLSKECSVCHKVKPLFNYHVGSRTKDGRVAQCKVCTSVYHKEKNQRKMQNADYFVTKMVQTCRGNDKKNDRECTLTEADVKEMYEEQGGKCHATFVPIFLKQGEWQASVDRIVGGSNGHSRDNVQLSCLEANNQKHWTRELTRELIAKSSEKFGEYDAVADELLAKYMQGSSGKRKKWPVILRDGASFVYCHKCSTEKPLSEFRKELSNGCKACQSRKGVEYNNTWRGVFKTLLNHSSGKTKHRNDKGRNHLYDIDIEYVAELFVEQEGRCFYSRAPLMREGPFKVSLERTDITKGYVKGNVVLICTMLNATDCSGETGWSRSKFLFMVKEFQAHDVAS
jgi:hypothetical protein